MSRDVLKVIENTKHQRIIDHYLIGTRMRLRCMEDSECDELIYKLTKKYGLGDAILGR